MSFSRFVALGDSFTEGVGDVDPDRPNGVRGWADRVAEVLAAGSDDFRYANLAIRGRKLRPILAEQLEPAIALEPDLVTIYAGANDIMRPSVDIDGLLVDYDAAVGRLAATGARVVLFTAFDPGGFPIFGTMRGRFATYNELVREIAEKHGTTLVDYWRMREYRDPGMWAEDRMHMSSAGHQRMAMAVLDAIGVDHELVELDLPPAPQLSKAERRAANLDWAKAHAAPWVKRRLTGKSSGDALDPRYPTLGPVSPAASRSPGRARRTS
ncbi:SGNH/GDSL hydrolase family protein [Aeromicrobium terrae]|uniref:SGNH/GDSL hydrolase family protein n=1 Tax=Aeromicrobium terrae TaxID=2498846 RepID=A0A5C8NGU4_9ACTN|nr:SGNH/GDSL hydrolase family protein [Aeromicrobium terrae]TXL57969.1 SGNH/GDSL hydrolase family protein [Aeromicrobium terrae]